MRPMREGGFLIAKIHLLSGRVFQRILKRHGIRINPGQGRVLFALWKQDGASIQELGRRTGLEKSTLTLMLDRLEKAGHLRRQPDPNDRRRVIVTRTPKDRELQAKYERASLEMNELFYKGMDERQVEALEAALRAVLANVQ